jgi:Holliday junction resolvase RusA-like endonuclease
MKYIVEIKGTYYGKDRTAPGWNDRIAASARHFREGGKMEHDFVMVCVNAIRSQLRKVKVQNAVRITYTFYETDERRDLGNIAFIDKPFEDALQLCKVLENDNQVWVRELHFIIGKTDKKNPRILVEIEEIE